MSEEKESKIQNWTLVLPVGALTLLGALMLSVSNEASVSLRLSEQHGQSILLLREEVKLLRLELKEQNATRYSAADADKLLERDLSYIKRDVAEIKLIIKEFHSGQ